MIKLLKKYDYRHYICILITISFLLLSIFYFKYAYLRIWESIIDFGTSSLFYINELFEFGWNINDSVNEFTKLPFEIPFNLANNWDEAKIYLSKYFELLFNIDNLKGYYYFFVDVLYYLSKIILISMPFVLIILIL